MAPRFHRRRLRADEALDPETSDTASLDDEGHAWWAQRDLADVWSPREAPPTAPEKPQRDVLAEHFGPDWRTSFGFDVSPEVDQPDDDVDAARPSPGPSPAPDHTAAEEPLATIDTSDPYAVLQVETDATWEEIVRAHRAMARRHHPDRLFGQAPREVAAAEDRIRAVNGAFAELRVRRGR